MKNSAEEKPDSSPDSRLTESFRHRLHTIIFEADTPAGKAFDVALIWLILLSVLVVMLESVRGLRDQYGHELYLIEWFFTFVFTIEYALRLYAVKNPLRYAKSFFGVIDLLAILPSYLSLFIPGAQSLLVIRGFRILRVFRIFRLRHYLVEAAVLQNALRAGRPKITVFLLAVSATILIVGTLMYLIEGEEHGFNNIPLSIYWAIVTMTTVGFGDITPQTPLGKILASALMIIGYGIIAVPTGIVTSELMRTEKVSANSQVCRNCGASEHSDDAKFCRICGEKLEP